MTTGYAVELPKLNGAYEAALSIDVAPLAACVEGWAARPMLMVGSGASFSVAKYAAARHEGSTGQLARAATPLEVMSEDDQDCGLVCFSAGGRNEDIIRAFRLAANREAEPLSALVLAENSPLERLGKRFGYTDVVGIGHPTFDDGFLAVATVIGSVVMLARAYRAVYGRSEKDIPRSVTELIRQATSFGDVEEIEIAGEGVILGREYVSVLYSMELASAAVDLESRFVEAALGALHIADLRNFGHGRHFWIARKAAETSVLALISEAQGDLGKRTVSLLPEDVNVLPIWFRGSNDLQGVAGLVVGMCLAASAARLAGFDPVRPGVPTFGRRLYHLKAKREREQQRLLNRSAALKRKGACADDSWWIARYERALESVNSSRYEALVLDYDGTLCDVRERAAPLGKQVAEQLQRLGDEGAVIGLATGRGPSAGKELRAALRKDLHPQVLIGYYNGAVIRRLSDEDDPIVGGVSDKDDLLVALAKDPMLNGRVRSNAVQISIGVRRGVEVEDGAQEVRLVLRQNGVEGDVVTSAHSIDVCLVGQSKEDLLEAMRESFALGDGPILRMGDRGRPPGNDWKLLDDAHGLSVDQVSGHAVHCWSLVPAGAKGTHAAVHYLRRLGWNKKGGGRLRLSGSSRP